VEGGDSNVHPQVLRLADACTLPAGHNHQATLPSRYHLARNLLKSCGKCIEYLRLPSPSQLSNQGQNPSIVVPISLSLANRTNSPPTTTSINPNPTLL